MDRKKGTLILIIISIFAVCLLLAIASIGIASASSSGYSSSYSSSSPPLSSIPLSFLSRLPNSNNPYATSTKGLASTGSNSNYLPSDSTDFLLEWALRVEELMKQLNQDRWEKGLRQESYEEFMEHLKKASEEYEKKPLQIGGSQFSVELPDTTFAAVNDGTRQMTVEEFKSLLDKTNPKTELLGQSLILRPL